MPGRSAWAAWGTCHTGSASMANIIDVLLSTHDEEKYHSRVLTWLADPHGSHGLGRAFFDALLEMAFPGWKFEEINQVRGELCLDSASTVDVGVSADHQILLIENKTRFSSITAGQLERYLQASRAKAPDKEVRLIHLLPGPRKEFPQLEKHDPDYVAVLFWAQVAGILGVLLSADAVSSSAVSSVSMHHDYLIRTVAQGGGGVALHPEHPRMSLSRSGFTTNFGLARNEFLAECRVRCADNGARLDLIHAFMGFLENLRLVRVEYKRGNSYWNATGSIPRADGGVTLLVHCRADGRITFEYRRLPSELADEYRRMTFNDPTKGWREVWIEALPLEQSMSAIRTVATKASMIELPVVR